MNYKETNLSGISWIRCNTVTITNPISGTTIEQPNSLTKVIEVIPDTPKIYFQEEKVMSIDGQQSIVNIGSCKKEFDPINGTIALRNPSTGELLGTSVTHQELYVILYSLYLQTAMERDAA